MNNPLLTAAEEHVGKDVMIIANVYTMRFEWVHPTLTKDLGYDPEELNGASTRDIVAVSYTKILELATRLAIVQNHEETQPVKRKDGRVVSATGIISAFTFEHEPYIAFTDVTLKDIDPAD